MTIIKKEIKNGLPIYTVKKDMNDEKAALLNGKKCTNKMFKTIIDHDCDVYTEDGKMLLRFRKNVLPQHNIDEFYENVINFAHHKTGCRGAESAATVKHVNFNKPIMSNVYGYFDTWTIFQKHIFKTLKIKPPFSVRVTRFLNEHPDKWQKMIPLIKNIDQMYKKLMPREYKIQRKCADETAFKIPDTSFTTMTTNLTTQMGIHRDSNNLKDSFGNLVVIEKGKYEGGYTGFPQFKVAVDVRTGDYLAMNTVDHWHGVTPIKLKTPDAERLSVVCYLRQGVWENSKGSTTKDIKHNQETMQKILERYNKKIHSKANK